MSNLEISALFTSIRRDDLPSTVALDLAFCEGKFGKGRAVSMNSHAEALENERIYTVGLCGCRCTIAKRGNLIQLAHYDPLATSRHVAALRAFWPDLVALWVPGEWIKNGDSWKLAPLPIPQELADLCTEVHGYSDVLDFGVPAMVDFDCGRVFAFGSPVVLQWSQTPAQQITTTP